VGWGKKDSGKWNWRYWGTLAVSDLSIMKGLGFFLNVLVKTLLFFFFPLQVKNVSINEWG